MSKKTALIGYSSHAWVMADILLKMDTNLRYYCEEERKVQNPFELEYLGFEAKDEVINKLQNLDYAIAVGNNSIRQRIFKRLVSQIQPPVNAIHPAASVSNHVKLGRGIMIGSGTIINPLARIADGVICNTGCIIEHGCSVGDFSHIAPGALLLGDVSVGFNCLVGGNAVIKQGVKIGDDVIIGAGSVVIRDVPDGVTVAGNPAREINS